MNNAFTCIGKGHGAPAIPATFEEWHQMRREPWLKEMCDKIAAGDEALKAKLPVWTPRCAAFRDNHRAAKDALEPLPLLMIDIDEKGHTEEIALRAGLPVTGYGLEESTSSSSSSSSSPSPLYLGPYPVVLIERSVRNGTHILLGGIEEKNIPAIQKEISELIGFPCDPAVKNVAGCIYMVSDDHTVYVAPGGKVKVDRLEVKEPTANSQQPTAPSPSSLVPSPQSSSYNGFPYSAIIAKYWELYNDGKEPQAGDRNVKTFELAVTLRSICNFNLQQLEAVIPRYDDFEEDEWRRTLESALKEPRKGMPYRMRQVLLALKEEQELGNIGGSPQTPPPLPKRLPPLLKLLTSKTPDHLKAAVAEGVFPALATYLHGVKFRYWDNVDHEATFMNVLIAPQGAGKGCVKKPIEYILSEIAERDAIYRERERTWKAKSKGMKDRPKDICIQCLVDDLTPAIFNQRVIDVHNNGEKYIYTIVDEIEGMRKVCPSGGMDALTLLFRKAFDNSIQGQERVSVDSVTGVAPLRWNWNASTTVPNARKFFNKAVNDGTLSRLSLSTIIREDGKSQDPIYGIYDEAFTEALKPYISKLDAASGLIECPQALKLSRKIKDDNERLRDMCESEAYLILSFRANVIAWLKGCVLYIAQGYKWTQEIADYVQWSHKYDLWCKMRYFGKQLERELETEGQGLSVVPQNMLDMLPVEFTEEQLVTLRLQMGKDSKSGPLLRKWKERGYIAYDDITGCWHQVLKV